jgi:DNA-binding Lrp family transcriptional regulator
MKSKAKTRLKQIDKQGILEKYSLTETDKKLIQYKLRFADISQVELAELLGCRRQNVSTILNKPEVKKTLKEFEGNWIEKILNAKEKAANQMIKLITNSNPAISIRACENILQLDKINNSALEPSELELLRQAAAEQMRKAL